MVRKFSGILVKFRKQVIPWKVLPIFSKTSLEINRSNWILPAISGFSIFLKSTWSRHDGKWRDIRRWERCQFSLSWINTTMQKWTLRLNSEDFRSYHIKKYIYWQREMISKTQENATKNERSGPRENGYFCFPLIRLSSRGSIGSLWKTRLWKQGLQTSRPPYLEFPAPAPLFVSFSL